MSALSIKNGKIVRRETRPVTNCDGCGACCRHMGTPPGYASYFARRELIKWELESPDHARYLAMPDDVKAELQAYYDGVIAGTIMDRTDDFASNDDVRIAAEQGRIELASISLRAAAQRIPIPCLWYDEQTKRCKHYEHRPETCRDEVMVPGNEACMATRSHFRIPLPQA